MAAPTPSAPRPASRPVLTWTPRQVFFGTLVVLSVALGFWLFIQMRLVVFSLFQAIVISTAISPAVEWLHRRGVARALGVVLIYLVLFILLVGLGLLVVPLILEQGATIAANFTSFYRTLLDQLHASPSRLIRRLAWQLPFNLDTAPVPAEAGDEQALDAVARALGYAGLVGESLFLTVAVLLLAFYWTLDRDRILRALPLLVPQDKREEVRELFLAMELKVGGYIRGIALLCVIVGALALGAYSVIGLPYALLLAVAAGLFEAVPLVGPALGALPALLIALSTAPDKVIWVLVATGLIQFIENTVLVPRVMGRAVGVNTVVTLLALAAFGSLFGLAGAFLAIPLAAIIKLLLYRYVLDKPGLVHNGPDGRDHVSVLRYDAQELVRDVRKQLRQKPVELDDDDQVEDSIEAIASDLDSVLAGLSQNAEQPV